MASKRKPLDVIKVAHEQKKKHGGYHLTVWSGQDAVYGGFFDSKEAALRAAGEVRLNGLSFGDPDGEWHCYAPAAITRLRIRPER